MSFLSPTQINQLTGTFQRHFSQFSTGIGNEITIYKEPLKSVNLVTSTNIYGYGEENNGNITDVVYQEVKGTVPCMIINSKNINSLPFLQLQTSIDESTLYIKVNESGKNYITNGKNEHALINNQLYDVINAYSTQSYFGLKFYYFKCNLRQ